MQKREHRQVTWTFALVATVACLDQLTKLWVWRSFRLGEARELVPGLLSLRYVRNEGAAFGLFAGHRWPLIAVSLGMLWMLCANRRELASLGRTGRLALGLLSGGIVGNLIDRLRYGYVVDFVDVFLGQSHFPAFNVADAAICVGVGLYMLASFRGVARATSPAPAKPEAATP